MQASFKASADHMQTHFYTWNKYLLNKLQDYIKSFAFWKELEW